MNYIAILGFKWIGNVIGTSNSRKPDEHFFTMPLPFNPVPISITLSNNFFLDVRCFYFCCCYSPFRTWSFKIQTNNNIIPH